MCHPSPPSLFATLFSPVFKHDSGACMVQRVEPLLVMPESHVGALVGVLDTPLPIHLPVTASRKAPEDGPGT